MEVPDQARGAVTVLPAARIDGTEVVRCGRRPVRRGDVGADGRRLLLLEPGPGFVRVGEASGLLGVEGLGDPGRLAFPVSVSDDRHAVDVVPGLLTEAQVRGPCLGLPPVEAGQAEQQANRAVRVERGLRGWGQPLVLRGDVSCDSKAQHGIAAAGQSLDHAVVLLFGVASG